MNTKLYYTISNNSYRALRRHMASMGIEFDLHKTTSDPLTSEEVMTMLTLTENGVDDILSTRSSTYKELERIGLDFESMSTKRFCQLVVDNPTLLKSPIVVTKNNIIIGYGEEQMSLLVPKEQRKKEMNALLQLLQQSDLNTPEQEAV